MESLGKTLKGLREEKGMTLTDVSKATKIRPAILSALENEEWDKLPQKIFVKGFVKAYVHAVEGDEEVIMDLFEASCPVEEAQITCPTFESKPMDSLVREKRNYKSLLILLLLLLIVGGLYFLFQKYGYLLQETSERPVKEKTTIVVPPKAEQAKPIPETVPSSKGATPENKAHPSSTVTAPSVMTTAGSPSPEASKTNQAPSPTENTATLEKPAASPPKTGETAIATPAPNSKQSENATENKSNDNLVIKAKMETWIGLKIDGKTRKEILLKPGKTFSTKVDKFVELLIGNAGGIDITFNGKEVENIGKPGQVVRLRLPKKETQETKKETSAP